MTRRSEDPPVTIPSATDLQPVKKIIFIVIDALRFDFVVPPPTNSSRRNLLFHGYLSALDSTASRSPVSPASSSASSPDSPRSNLLTFHFLADPPTTTMQRLKALTTGTLPTFIDAGNNFASSAIEEDNWLDQCNRLKKPIVFMGDDTWTSLYPNTFAHQHPYPSLNVFDMHTVDEGCLEHIWKYVGSPGSRVKSSGGSSTSSKPRSQSAESNWSLLIAHFLGVDHCGHRYGPNHVEMTKKLRQLNGFLEDLMDRMDEDTILLVMGDHGMDEKGDHGGDSNLEVDAALVAYRKRPWMNRESQRIWNRFKGKLDRNGFAQTWSEASETRFPAVTQIDLVPTLSLMMGIPIPFGSLGALIPQFFFTGDDCGIDGRCIVRVLVESLSANVQQLSLYLGVYTNETGSDFPPVKLRELEILHKEFEDFKSEWSKTESEEDGLDAAIAAYRYLKTVLTVCREMWAQFDMGVMVFGGVVLLATLALHILLMIAGRVVQWRRIWLPSMVAGLLTSLAGNFAGSNFLIKHFAGGFATTGLLLAWLPVFGSVPMKSRISFGWPIRLAILLTLLHSVIFLTNSFIIHENQVTFYLLQTISAYILWDSLQASSRSPWYRHPILLVVLTRMASSSVQCREEQLPKCESTFYATPPLHLILGLFHSTSTTWIALIPLFCLALWFPSLLKRSLEVSGRTVQAVRLALLCLAFFWTGDYLESHSSSFGSWIPMLPGKAMFARISFSIGALSILNSVRTHLYFMRTRPNSVHPPNRNSFLLGIFLLVISAQTPSGIWMLSLCLWKALILRSWSVRRSRSLSTDKQALVGVALSLLGWQHFFATGHQATFSSIQFQTGFIGLEEFDFFLSGALVTLNSLGPSVLCATMVFLFADHSALSSSSTSSLPSSRTELWFLLHRAITTLVSTLFTGYFRRHLMVWKIFAPRWMLSGLDLVAIQLTLVALSLIFRRELEYC